MQGSNEGTWSVRETVNSVATVARSVNGLAVETTPAAITRSRVDHLVSKAVAADPTALAVASLHGDLTYGELDLGATTVADELRRLGVGPGDLVALTAARSPAMVVGALGILKAQAAYVSIDPSYPRERIAFMLSDCGTRVVVESSPDPCVPKVTLMSDPSQPGEVTFMPASDDDPAYVIYTSGSTGSPKGVVVNHASLLNLVRWHQDAFKVAAPDRASLVASPGFDASVWELWPYLVTGASLHIPADCLRRDPVGWRDWLVQNRITVAYAPTAIAERLMELRWPKDAALRYLLTGGDVLAVTPPPGLPFVVVNNYGVTEAAVVSTSTQLSPSESPASTPPIGRPITGAELHVVDEKLVPVAAGDPGELLIGGVSVASGYLNREELTAERFIADHLGCDPGARLYRTGDLVRMGHGGNLEFLGRLDEQVKVRGYRIECGEVAVALLRHSDVRSCVVVATGDGPPERRLVAYLVARGERQPDVDEMRVHLGLILPDYMVPSAFVWLAELPTSPNGKIDRRALPAPDVAEREWDGDDPRTDLEHAIGAIVMRLLGLASIGVEENFFLLGGHSLLAAQLIAALSDHVGVELPLRAVFEGPSIRELADEIERLVLEEIEAMSEDEAEQHLSRISRQA
jgi:amino acid adenylation domain-containing protein